MIFFYPTSMLDSQAMHTKIRVNGVSPLTKYLPYDWHFCHLGEKNILKINAIIMFREQTI